MNVAGALLGGIAVYLGLALFLGVAPNVATRRRTAPQISRQQLWLIQAGSELTPQQFWGASFGVGFAAFLFLWLVTGSWPVAIGPAIAIGLLPRAYYSRERSKRIATIQAAWPDGIRDVLAHVSSGSTLPKALEALAESGPEPLRFAFARFPLRARMFGVVPALEMVKEELADPTSDKVIEVLILAHEYGGDLVQDVLRDLIDAIAEDLRTIEEIRTAGLEQKIESWLVVVVPWLVLVFLASVPPAYVQFYRSGAGQTVVLVALIWSGFGILLLRAMSRDRGERRVLGGGAEIAESQR